MTMRWIALPCTAWLVMTIASPQLSAVRTDEPETVMVTLHAKAGAEADAVRVLARHWETARRLNLVRDSPHLTLRTSDPDNRASFVEIFTWRDAGIPDHAPDAIRAIWDEMNALAEPRAGHGGIEIAAVQVVE